jgi:hypothetical protein
VIADNAVVSLLDGTQLAAMEVYPGRDLLSFQSRHTTHARVLDRKVETRQDAICLVLSNSLHLCGSPDQKVAVVKEKTVQFRMLSQVGIGDRLRGERAGMPVTLTVIGLLFYPRKNVRLVGFTLDHEKTFIAEGVLCRG